MNPVQFGVNLPSFDSIGETVRKPNASPVFAGSLPVSDSINVRFGNTPKIDRKAVAEDFRQRGVVVAGGGGTMGSAIATDFLNNDVPVSLLDKEQRFADNGIGNIAKNFGGAVKAGLFSEAEAREKAGRVWGTYATDDGGVTQLPKNTAFAIEAVFENPAVKADIFKQMDEHFDPSTILATNTSSLSVNDLAQSVSPERRKNFVGVHYFLPAHINALVEVIAGKDTAPETADKAFELMRAMGKLPIKVAKDSPGFLVNRVLVSSMNEGVRELDRLVEEDVKAFTDKNGRAPSDDERREITRAAATNVDEAFYQTVWPLTSATANRDKLIGPVGGMNNPIYMGLMGEIAKILHEGLGDGYKPAKSIIDMSEKFRALGRGASPEQVEALKIPMGGKELIDPARVQQLKEHFQGHILTVMGQLVDEGVGSAQDINKGMMIGTQWENPPVQMMNDLGPVKALELAKRYAAENPAMGKVPDFVSNFAKSGKSVDPGYVTSRLENGTMTITIDRQMPKRENALDFETLDLIEKAFDKAERDPNVKNIVFESIGGKNFVYGADLYALQGKQQAVDAHVKKRYGFLPKALRGPIGMAAQYKALYPFLRKGDKVFDRIAHSDKPTIAKVNGRALGGGTELALACDYIVASENATFGLPEVKYGIFPAWGGTERLGQRVGKSLAKFLVLEGGKMDDKGRGDAILNAVDARTVGLADVVVPHENLDEAVTDMVDRGLFSKKPQRTGVPPAAVSFQTSDGMGSARYAESRFPAKQERYAGASLGDLLGNELQGLYKPAAALAFNRVARGEKPNRLQQERELLQMATNMAGAQAWARKQAKAGK